MPTFNNGEEGLIVRQKINDAIRKADGDLPFLSVDIQDSSFSNSTIIDSSLSNSLFTGTAEFDQIVLSGDTLTIPTGNTAQRPGPPDAGMLRFNTELSTFEGYDGSEWGLIGGGLKARLVNSNYSASAQDNIFADTTSGQFTITLPANPLDGDAVKISGKGWANNSLLVDLSGNSVEGVTDTLELDVEEAFVELVWDTITWQLFTNIYRGNIQAVSTNLNSEFTMPLISPSTTGYETVNTANNITFNPSTGTLTVTDVNTLSDMNVKKDIRSIDSIADKLFHINPVEFIWKDKKTKSYGVIAQELESIFPELVSQKDDTKYVNYIPMIALLIEGYKDLTKKVNNLEDKKRD